MYPNVQAMQSDERPYAENGTSRARERHNDHLASRGPWVGRHGTGVVALCG
jgi:hypothetical protein